MMSTTHLDYVEDSAGVARGGTAGPGAAWPGTAGGARLGEAGPGRARRGRHWRRHEQMNLEHRYPGGDSTEFRISHSTLQTYLMCGLRWFYEQEERRRHATVAMLVGSATSAAAHFDNSEKLNERRASLSELVEAGVDCYEEALEDSEVPESAYEVERGKDDAADASRAFGELLSPGIQPIMAEEKVIAVIDEGIELAGTLDVAEKDTVRDLKTGRAWTQARADRSRQLTGYSLLFEARTGDIPARVAIDSLHKDSRGRWKATTLWSQRTERDRLAFIETVRRAKAGMDAGVALPAAEGSWHCSEKWCCFWKTCTARPGA